MNDEESNKNAEVVTSVLISFERSQPKITIEQVVDPIIIDQDELLKEAIYQCTPLALPGSEEASRATRYIMETTARPNGIRESTAELRATSSSELKSFLSGTNPKGKANEIVVAHDYRVLQNGGNPQMTNPPNNVAKNVRDVRLSPDTSSKRDLLFVIDKGGLLSYVEGPGVKSGTPKYITDSLVERAKTPGYSKLEVVDSRFVNDTGTPRNSEDAFNKGQVNKLHQANSTFRGVKDQNIRADRLIKGIENYLKDGLDPIEREQLDKFRMDITRAYSGKSMVHRVFGGAAVTFVTSATISLIVQAISNGDIDGEDILDSGIKATVLGLGTNLADAGLYNLGTSIGFTPEISKVMAHNTVTTTLCLFAIFSDLITEIELAKTGQITKADAIAGSSLKVAADVLPIVLVPMGPIGIPIMIGAQVGGRLLLQKARQRDAEITRGVINAMNYAENLESRIDDIIHLSDENDRLFSLLGLQLYEASES